MSKLEKRVALLEEVKRNTNIFVGRLLKYDMTIRRTKQKRKGLRSDYTPKKPNIDTCRRFGKANVKEVRAMREARKQGKDISVVIWRIL